MIIKKHIIVICVLFISMEAKVSGRVDNVGLEFVVDASPLIVVAKPVKNTEQFDNITFDDGSSYDWNVQDFKVLEILKQGQNGIVVPKVTINQIMSVANFDGYKFTIAKKYSEGIRKIGWYKIYPNQNITKDEKRVLFLTKWNPVGEIFKDKKSTAYMYAIENGFDSIKKLEIIKNKIKEKYKSPIR